MSRLFLCYFLFLCYLSLYSCGQHEFFLSPFGKALFVCAFESSWKGRHQRLGSSRPLVKNMPFTSALYYVMWKKLSRSSGWRSSQRCLKSWEQVILRIHEFLEWISKQLLCMLLWNSIPFTVRLCLFWKRVSLS